MLRDCNIFLGSSPQCDVFKSQWQVSSSLWPLVLQYAHLSLMGLVQYPVDHNTLSTCYHVGCHGEKWLFEISHWLRNEWQSQNEKWVGLSPFYTIFRDWYFYKVMWIFLGQGLWTPTMTKEILIFFVFMVFGHVCITTLKVWKSHENNNQLICIIPWGIHYYIFFKANMV